MPESKNEITFEKKREGDSMKVALNLRADGSGAEAGVSFLIEGLTHSEHLPAQKTGGSRILSLDETKALAKKLEEFIRQGEEFMTEN